MDKTTKAAVICIILFTGVITVGLAALNAGYSRIPYEKLLHIISGNGAPHEIFIVTQLRMPRIAAAILCGAGLAVAGCILQAITGNPLADSGMIGINAGAGLAVLIFLTYFSDLQISSMIFMPIFAFLGASAVAFFLYRFSTIYGKMSAHILLVAGIAMSAGISALMLIIGTNMESGSYQSVARWLAGSIWGTNWLYVKTLLPYLMILMPLVFSKAKIMDALTLGEDTAMSLGVYAQRERKVLLLFATALAAASISVSGGIGFIGLIAPHIARRLVGIRHHILLPVSALVGSLVLLSADTFARSAFQPWELPAGIIVSIIAAPYFLYLLQTKGI